ncbi:MAG: hypothetical protein R3E66_03995 [bacterium]
MLAAHQPFDAPTPLAVLFQHINEPLPLLVPRPRVVVPEAMQEILRIATAKDVKGPIRALPSFSRHWNWRRPTPTCTPF